MVLDMMGGGGVQVRSLQILSSPLILQRGSAELMWGSGAEVQRGEHEGLASATQWSTVPLARCAQFTSVIDEGDSEARAGV